MFTILIIVLIYILLGIGYLATWDNLMTRKDLVYIFIWLPSEVYGAIKALYNRFIKKERIDPWNIQ